MGHVLARVSGYGWAIVPHFPFRFAHVEGNARALRVERGDPTPKAATVIIEAGGPRLELSSGAKSAAEVCDLIASDALDGFRVETSVFAIGWPTGFDVVSGEPGSPSPFDFVSDEGSLLYVQGPLAQSRVPRLEAMSAPGQRIIGRGTHPAGEWIELSYEHGGRAHWQRHATVRWARETMLVLTAQALVEQTDTTRAAASFALGTLRPLTG
jgi:hypothetical protein